MNADVEHLIALTTVETIGPNRAKSLLAHFGSAQEVFSATLKELTQVPHFGECHARKIVQGGDYNKVKKEITFIQKNEITILSIADDLYPERLKQISGSPVILYYKGKRDLNAKKIVAIVGTRQPTEYGRGFIEDLLSEFSNDDDLIIISGLAHGIDHCAHQTAMKNNLATVGVLGHGLDRIYPYAHRKLALEMTASGGLLTEFMTGTKPDRENFPMRNRIIAGMADAVIVVESAQKGGSMITADFANQFNRDVFALPGRTTDERSIGCNMLIKSHRANLIESAKDLRYIMGWDKRKDGRRENQLQLFDFSPEEADVYKAINDGDDPIHIDDLLLRFPEHGQMMSMTLLGLEMRGAIKALPGGMYRT